MASLDSLPADQKAVLSLVLQRGRTFDQIATMLVIDRASVRQRALEGLDALGPETSVEPLKRGLITDYLLGQLPPAVADSVFTSLAKNPPERAWARVVAAEIAPLATNGLPEIPAPGAVPPARPASPPPARPASSTTAAAPAPPTPAPTPVREPDDTFEHDVVAPAATASTPGADADPSRTALPHASADSADGDVPPSSRRGGAILLGLIALVIVVIVVVLIVTGGSSKKTATTTTSAKAPSVTSTTGTTTSTTTATPLHQINLVSPTNTKGREGAADVVRSNGVLGLVLVAEGLTPNKSNAYAVWLYDSSSGGSHFLGFYNNPVASSGTTKGELEAEVKLPANAKKYNELLLTLETTEKPTKPGTVVLEGTFAE